MTTKQKIPYAGFWRRFAAFFLDFALFFTFTAPLLFLIYGHDYFIWLLDASFFSSFGVFDFILTKLTVIIAILFFWQKMGATPGKWLLGCRIVDAKTHQAISWKQSLIRLGGYVVSALPAYMGFFWMAWDKQKQGLHDKLAQTVVLHQEEDYADIPLQQLMENLK